MRFTTLGILLLLAGCGKTPGRPHVEGKVSFQGKPVAGRTLVLVFDAPAADSFAHNFPLADDGSFKGEVARPGPYKVVIAESMAAVEGNAPKHDGPNDPKLPAKYREAKTTDLAWTVEMGANSKEIELKE